MSDTYEEVVTSAAVRYGEVPGLAGEVALLTLDNGFDHTKPTTFGPNGLDNIGAALDEIEAHEPKVRAVAVTGKPFIFAVGADLKGVGAVQTREEALEVGRLGHRVFARLRDLDVPAFAFVNGAAMGGGLEIALHCDYRTISTGVPAVALPECFLGLVPGWGGTQLLPNLIGPEKAAKVVLEPLGLPMSPLQLLSFTGLAVSQHVAETLHQAFSDRFYVSPNLGRLVENGVTSLFGPDGGIAPEAEKLFETGSTELTAEQVRQNALDAIADEARRILDEGVVAEPQDVDLALLLGGGWAFANGGITPLLDRTGTSERVTGKRFLPQGVASLPA